MKQYDIILKAMLNNKDKKEWKATDFQKEPYFVGYEASPRMSELARMYPDLIKTSKNGRFRILSINWDYENIDEYVSEYKEEPFFLLDKNWIEKHIPNIY